ncbi:MAG: hypothetical protein ACR2HY_00605 [Acidimicrobiales bacterium]
MPLLEHLPPRYRNAATARALTAPSAVLVAGAGVSVAILAGVPLVGAALVGAACWAARVALGLPRPAREERIDPAAVAEPWRSFVRKAVAARNRFDRAVSDTEPGPLHDRLAEMAQQVSVGAAECWRVAKRAAALDAAVKELDAPGVRAQLDRCHADLQHAPSQPELAATAESLSNQLASAARLAKVAADARERLRRVDAQLDEAVARALELSLQSGGPGDVASLGSAVDGVVGELESLRQALDESRA